MLGARKLLKYTTTVAVENFFLFSKSRNKLEYNGDSSLRRATLKLHVFF